MDHALGVTQMVPPGYPESTPTTVITGFLGSGKTTLLNALLRDPELRDTAVLVNELGEIGIDHLLVERLDEQVVLLNAGCLCCTVREDLVGALAGLFHRRAAGEVPVFRRVVIETTGLADPAPILHTLLSHEQIRGRYSVDGIITTVDALNGDRQLTEEPECIKQVAVADRLVLTKTDIAQGAPVDRLRARLSAINPGAPLLDVVNGGLSPVRLLDAGRFDPRIKPADVVRWLNEAAGEHRPDPTEGDSAVNRHDDRIRTFTLLAQTPIAIVRFIAWVETLLATHGDKLLRLKGVLNAIGSEKPIVVHGVQHVFHPLASLPSWPGEERTSRLVLIARDLDAEAVTESFHRDVLR